MHLANHVFLITLIHHSLGFSFMGVLKGMKDNIYYYSVSPFFEQCDSRWIKSDIQAELVCDKSGMGLGDMVVFMAGTNDVSRNETQHLRLALRKRLQDMRGTNVVVFSIPRRHDLESWSCVNSEGDRANEEIQKTCKHFPNVTYVGISNLGCRFHTTQGLHLKRLGLEKDLHSYVFGQELASDVVLVALRSHSSNSYKKKPLVLNFHGWPGGGKGYVADFILKNWFKEGEKSKFVKKYLSKLHFPLKSEVHTYQKRLQRELEDTVRRCPRSMFVFDEVDKYPPHLLDGIKPYLDYNTNVNGVDFRQAVFIFITNNGDELINKIVLRKRKNGFSREDLKLSDFEHMLKTESFNDEGGFYKSDMIKHHLIDHVVPFLPLEREHVASCVQAEFLFQGGHPSFIQDVISEIISEITFGPDGDEIYSINGCKVISNKVAYILEREKRRRRRRKFEEDL